MVDSNPKTSWCEVTVLLTLQQQQQQQKNTRKQYMNLIF